MRVVCERKIRVEAPAEAVFESLLDPAFVFSLNLFHRAVDCDDPTLRRGSIARIDHRFFGLRRELRVARVHCCADGRVAWGELADGAHDVFPHSQSFTIRPLSKATCAVLNELRGSFRFPGARLWTPVYRVVVPRILDAENRKIRARFALTLGLAPAKG